MVGEIQVVGLASCREDNRYLINRGSKSRNKVAVGEPAAGSFFRCLHTLKNKTRGAPVGPSHTKPKKLLFCRSTPVEHGSHNVSRWMTWLSISLKNAAACDKWYQLQNHSITESLNANGAWEKPFVGHPRACHSQCRTNKKSTQPAPILHRMRGTIGSPLLNQEPELRRGAHIYMWRAAVWLGVCCVPRTSPCIMGELLAARPAQPNVFQKKHCVFSLCNNKNSLVYRPEHGRTTRRT